MAMGKQVSWRAGQLDLYRNSPDRMAQAYRTAAESALVDPHFPQKVRQQRHDHYITKARELEERT